MAMKLTFSRAFPVKEPHRLGLKPSRYRVASLPSAMVAIDSVVSIAPYVLALAVVVALTRGLSRSVVE